MALILNGNCGFVHAAPTSDPLGTGSIIDNQCWAIKVISPQNANFISEVGWWCDDATEAANFEIGLYSDAGAGEPEDKLLITNINAKGTTAGWKKKAVGWNISGSTTYWLAVQLDNTATGTSIDVASSNGIGRANLTSPQTELPNDWGSSYSTDSDGMAAIYAVWTNNSNILGTIEIGTGTHGTRFIKTDYPVTEGTTAGTTKLREKWILEAEESHVFDKDREGI